MKDNFLAYSSCSSLKFIKCINCSSLSMNLNIVLLQMLSAQMIPCLLSLHQKTLIMDLDFIVQFFHFLMMEPLIRKFFLCVCDSPKTKSPTSDKSEVMFTGNSSLHLVPKDLYHLFIEFPCCDQWEIQTKHYFFSYN